jgi:hypothetical protein
VVAAFLGDCFAALPAPPVVPADVVAARLFGDDVVAECLSVVVFFAEPFRAEVFGVAVVAEPFFAEILFAEPFFATVFFAPGRLTVRLRVVAMMAPWCEECADGAGGGVTGRRGGGRAEQRNTKR